MWRALPLGVRTNLSATITQGDQAVSEVAYGISDAQQIPIVSKTGNTIIANKTDALGQGVTTMLLDEDAKSRPIQHIAGLGCRSNVFPAPEGGMELPRPRGATPRQARAGRRIEVCKTRSPVGTGLQQKCGTTRQDGW
jgi:hypothetical protein